MSPDTNTTSKRQAPHRRDQELDRRYGEIGISAVAAAVRCQNFDRSERPDDRRSRSDQPDKAA